MARKLQIAIIIAGILIVGWYFVDRAQKAARLRTTVTAIGEELIRTKASPALVHTAPYLRVKLHELLDVPAKVQEVRMGDARPPIGDGRAACQLLLVNERNERLGIRLSPDAEPGKFHVIGFWMPE